MCQDLEINPKKAQPGPQQHFPGPHPPLPQVMAFQFKASQVGPFQYTSVAEPQNHTVCPKVPPGPRRQTKELFVESQDIAQNTPSTPTPNWPRDRMTQVVSRDQCHSLKEPSQSLGTTTPFEKESPDGSRQTSTSQVPLKPKQVPLPAHLPLRRVWLVVLQSPHIGVKSTK